MSGIIASYKLINAAAQDAGNRSMQAGGRTVWNETDWAAACDEFNRLADALELDWV